MPHTKHSRHHTPPSLSVFAALSSFFPHPGLPSSFLRPFASRPPHIRHVACQREPCGPGTTPRSIGETALWQPGHADEVPKRGCGKLKDACEAGAVFGGGS